MEKFWKRINNMFTGFILYQGRNTNNFYLSQPGIVTSVDVVQDHNAEEIVHESVTFIKDVVVNQCVDMFS